MNRDDLMLSVLIPTHNEGQNIRTVIEDIIRAMHGHDYEIIIVDDCSTDSTRDEIRKLMVKNERIILHTREKKHGIGSAYKHGIRHSKGSHILTIDADLSHDPKDIPRFLKCKEQEEQVYDIVIGSRFVPGGKRNDPFHRRIFPKLGSVLYRLILRSDIKDITSGYRLYRKKTLESIDIEALPDDFSFQAAIIFALKENGAKSIEIPIIFSRRQSGTPKYTTRDLISNLRLLMRLAYCKHRK